MLIISALKNDKIKDDLGVVLKYPDYKAGLQGCLDAEGYAEEQANGKNS